MKKQDADHIEALLAQLREEFLQELPSRIMALENLVLELDHEDNYQEIFRTIHSLKGSGGTHGVELLSFACHQLEEVLQQHEKDQFLAEKQGQELLLSYLDVLKQIYNQAYSTQSSISDVKLALQELRLQHTGKNAEVLVVEPTTTSSQLITQSLEVLPVNITRTDSGLAALELLLHRRFHVIVTAKETSALNGAALISSIKSTPQYENDTICILISSNPQAFRDSLLAPDYVLKRDMQLGEKLHEIIGDFLQTIEIPQSTPK